VYRWIRNTHLFLGLFSAAFLLMYGVSAIQMAHSRWFPSRPKVTQSEISISAANGGGVRSVARELMDRHGMKGELQQVREAEGGIRFNIVRPGTVYEVDYSPSMNTAKVRTNTANFIGMLNRIHHIGGLWHEYSIVNVWGFFVGVISAAIILLSLSGIYLWFKIHTERVIGTILLAVSLGYSLTLIVLLRMAA
jgi:hypothetical protein